MVIIVVGACVDESSQGSAYVFVEPGAPEIEKPVGGHTEPVSPLVLLWPWLLLAAAVVTAAIAALALKRRTA
ncbi:MAG: hypothetical protein H8E35_00410 [Ardenticatenia bacterium]|nr:hypothetical protein [Ardenticatenia bacterium]